VKFLTVLELRELPYSPAASTKGNSVIGWTLMLSMFSSIFIPLVIRESDTYIFPSVPVNTPFFKRQMEPR
jgi:hypothetical protein